jgi:small-conductance mechanosensitive channel
MCLPPSWFWSSPIPLALTDSIAGVEDVLSDPAPAIQASGVHNTAITLTVSYWYPSSMSSGSSATDGVIRAVKKALANADIEPAFPTVEIDQRPSATASGDTPHIASHDNS